MMDLDQPGDYPPQPVPTRFSERHAGRPRRHEDVDLALGEFGLVRDGGTNALTKWRTSTSHRWIGAVLVLLALGLAASFALLLGVEEESTAKRVVPLVLLGVGTLAFGAGGIHMLFFRVDIVVDHAAGELRVRRRTLTGGEVSHTVRLADVTALALCEIRRMSSDDDGSWDLMLVAELRDGRLVSICVNCPEFEREFRRALAGAR